MHHSKQKNDILWRFAATKSISGPLGLHFRQIWQTTPLLVMWRLSSLSTCDKAGSRPQHHITLSATFPMSSRRQSMLLVLLTVFLRRSYWIPGSSAPTLSEKGNAFLRPLKKKGFKEARVTRMRLDNLSTSTTLESNKSQLKITSIPT